MKTYKNARWKTFSDVRSTYTEDGATLLQIGRGLCYSLNPVAARIWASIEKSPDGTTLDGIVTALETDFSMPRHQLLTDSYECLQKLQQDRLIHCNGETVPKKTGKWGWQKL